MAKDYKNLRRKTSALEYPTYFISCSQTAAPKNWIAFDGGVTKMDTPYTLRAAQLRDLYNSVTETDLSRDERLDVLLTLKATVRVSQGH